MAGNQTLLVEVDWSSKSGSADSTIAFNETFDISLKGVNNFGEGSNVRLVLSTAQTGLDASNILYVVSKAPALDDGALRINAVRVATQEVLDTLNQQGGKGNFYLFVMEERADGSLVDFGSCRVKMMLGGYTEDTVLPENIEGMPTIKELQDSIAAINGSLAKAEAAAKRAETAADGLSADVEGLQQVASEAKAESAAAKATADKAESIAKGAQYAKVFATESEMKTWAAAEMAKAEDQREVKVGDNLYIKDTGVPDYWWTGEDSGYAQLETGAVKVEVDTALDANSINPIANSAVKAETNRLDQNITDETTRASAVEQALVAKDTEQGEQLGALQSEIEDVRSYLFETNTMPTPTGNVDAFGYRGTLADLGVYGSGIKIYKLAIITRNGTCQNSNVPLWARVLKKASGSWTVCAQSKTSRKWNEVGQNQELAWEMEPVAGVTPPSTDEEIAIVWVNNANAAATALNGSVSFRIIPGTGGISAESLTATAQAWKPVVRFVYQSVALSGGGASFAYADMFAATATTHGDKTPASIGSSGCGKTIIGYCSASHIDNTSNVVILGQRSLAYGADDIIIGNDVTLSCSVRVYVGTNGEHIGANLISYIDNYCGSDFSKDNGAIMFTACNASVFFASDACGATVIGGKMKDGCYSAKALEDIFNGGGGGGGSSSALIEGVNVDGSKNGAASAYCGSGLLAIGYCSGANYNYSIVVGHSSVAPFKNSIVFGHDVYGGKYGSLAEYLYCKIDVNTNDNGAVIFDTNPNKAEATRAFFAVDGYGNTLIGGVVGYDSTTCLKQYGYVSIADLKELVDNGGGGGGVGGDSYIKASTSGSPYDIPGCSSGITIGPNACIVNDVTNGLAIGIGVEATRWTPVIIGSGCASITVNSNYELCVGGKLVGGSGGSSNDSICVYDSVGYCAIGVGSNYVAIGDESTAYTGSVAIGVSAYAGEGEVAIGMGAGNNARVNGFITENSLYNVRRFRASNCSAGNELFFATINDKAVLGGEFVGTTNETGSPVTSLCYFYLQDVADMLANGGGGVEFDDAPTKGSSTKTISSDWFNRHLGYSGPVEIGKGAKGNHTYISVDGQTQPLGGAVAIGENAVSGSYGVAIGSSATLSAGESVAIGHNSGSTAYSAVAIGYNAKASETTPIVIGASSTAYQITVSATGALCIGGQEVAKLSTMQTEVARLVSEQYSSLDARISNLALRVAELEGVA